MVCIPAVEVAARQKPRLSLVLMGANALASARSSAAVAAVVRVRMREAREALGQDSVGTTM
jgi:hypothetical protein